MLVHCRVTPSIKFAGNNTPYSKMAATQDSLGRVAWKRGIEGHGTRERLHRRRSSRIWRPAVFVKTRVWVGCSVSRAQKTSLVASAVAFPTEHNIMASFRDNLNLCLILRFWWRTIFLVVHWMEEIWIGWSASFSLRVNEYLEAQIEHVLVDPDVRFCLYQAQKATPWPRRCFGSEHAELVNSLW